MGLLLLQVSNEHGSLCIGKATVPVYDVLSIARAGKELELMLRCAAPALHARCLLLPNVV